MIRHLSIYFLVIALLFNAFGAYLVFDSARRSAKKEIKKRIKNNVPEEELYVLSFSRTAVENGSAGLTWKDACEFVYKGKMYDIVRTEESQNSITYYCINDAQEEQLFAKLNEMVDDFARHDKNTQNSTNLKLSLIIHEVTLITEENIFMRPSIDRLFREYFPEKYECFILIPDPPPRFA